MHELFWVTGQTTLNFMAILEYLFGCVLFIIEMAAFIYMIYGNFLLSYDAPGNAFLDLLLNPSKLSDVGRMIRKRFIAALLIFILLPIAIVT